MKQLGDVTEIKEKEKNCPKTFNNVRCERQYGWEIGRAGEQTRPGHADTPIVLKGQFLCTHASLSYLNIERNVCNSDSLTHEIYFFYWSQDRAMPRISCHCWTQMEMTTLGAVHK